MTTEDNGRNSYSGGTFEVWRPGKPFQAGTAAVFFSGMAGEVVRISESGEEHVCCYCKRKNKRTFTDECAGCGAPL